MMLLNTVVGCHRCEDRVVAEVSESFASEFAAGSVGLIVLISVLSSNTSARCPITTFRHVKSRWLHVGRSRVICII